MTASSLSTRNTYLYYLFIVSFLGIFSSISNASTKQTVETQSASSSNKNGQEQAANQLIGVMYTNQQMQLETIKEQYHREIETLRIELSEMDNSIEKFQSDLDSQKQALESGRLETASVGKRVDDSLIYSGQSLERFGLGITIVLAVVGFVGYFSFAEKTKRETRSVAEQWFSNQTSDLQGRIKVLEDEFKNARDKISEHVDAVGRFAEESKIEIHRYGSLVASEDHGSKLDLSPVVQQRADLLRDIPISNYKYDDWNSLAYASYSNSKFEEAALYWLRASEALGASDHEIAIALYNRGVAQRQLNQPEAAVRSFDEVVRRFGNSIEFGLKKMIAKALFNKGVMQSRLNQPDVAVGTYDEVIHRFGNAIEPALKEQVAYAYNGIGFFLLCQGKSALAKGDAAEAETKFNQAIGYSDRALTYLEPYQLNGIVLGNRAYALVLLGDIQPAEAIFATALRAPVNGGKELYDGTLADFDIHPVAQDESMRALVEHQWKLWLAE